MRIVPWFRFIAPIVILMSLLVALYVTTFPSTEYMPSTEGYVGYNTIHTRCFPSFEPFWTHDYSKPGESRQLDLREWLFENVKLRVVVVYSYPGEEGVVYVDFDRDGKVDRRYEKIQDVIDAGYAHPCDLVPEYR